MRIASDNLTAGVIEKAVPAELSRAHALALLQMSREMILRSGSVEEAMELAEPLDVVSESLEMRLLAERVVYNGPLQSALAGSLVGMRDWLADRLEQQQDAARCTLLAKVNAVPAVNLRPTLEPNIAVAGSLIDQGIILAPAVKEVLQACYCNSLLPPCAACDDTGVLLACLTVEDCKVTEICNLDRKFVLTGPNVRYWFPAICQAGKEIEKSCCPSCDKKDTQQSPIVKPRIYGTFEEAVRAALGSGSGYSGMAMSAILDPSVASGEALQAEDSSARNVSVDLQRQLQNTLAEIKSLRRDHAKLQNMVSRLEKEKAPEAKVAAKPEAKPEAKK